MNKPSTDVSHYLALPYTVRLRRDEDGDVVGRIEELPGCVAHGRDEADALQSLREMQKLWLEDCIAAGDPIPEPQETSRSRAASGFSAYPEVCIGLLSRWPRLKA